MCRSYGGRLLNWGTRPPPPPYQRAKFVGLKSCSSRTCFCDPLVGGGGRVPQFNRRPPYLRHIIFYLSHVSPDHISMELLSSHGWIFILLQKIKTRIGPIKYTQVCIHTYICIEILKGWRCQGKGKRVYFPKPDPHLPPYESSMITFVIVLISAW